ncbi:hypothetical protein FE257_009123 [Aspergillus nanangensis]|uniref:Uncharacterized protein n=1 Tax=Aspergillus nanangensis TaxID=2582783 RepID=A0AAD4CWR9_ASPNN|nr:hypothetical protein FE257_009123 [Aspergillus nanangensis]
MELHTPMDGLDSGDEIRFHAGSCVVKEYRRYCSGEPSDCRGRVLQEEEIDQWIEQRGEFHTEPSIASVVRWIFVCTSANSVDWSGNYLASPETLDISISEEAFNKLIRQYPRPSQILDAWRTRSSSGCGFRQVVYDERTGDIQSINFVVSIRLSGSFASVVAIKHDLSHQITTVLALRVSPYEQERIAQTLQAQSHLIGHPLLVLTMLVEISLATNLRYLQKIRHELSVIEKATGQHGWLQIPATEAPAHDSELSRLGHAAKIHVSLSRRRVDSIRCVLGIAQKAWGEFGVQIASSFLSSVGAKDAYQQWLANIALQLDFRQVDMQYSQLRVDNQITAIYGLLSQRDNMLSVSVALQSKKISEASKRDGSALKSLTVLTALFFPATYVATLFTLPLFEHTPFWVYWVVVIPLTFTIFGSWSGWTLYRQHQIAQETIQREISQDVDVSAEPDMASHPPSSFLRVTLQQIRQHSRALHSHELPKDGYVKG